MYDIEFSFVMLKWGFFVLFFSDETRHFLHSYKDVCKYFVKTRLVEECQNSLCQNGITILSGQQGSGKTLAAVYIMSTSRKYKKWTKIKCTSWVDLLTLKLEANTLVYIDNLFDGYMYPEELRKWWCSLCYFYFEKIQIKNDIHLLITAKTDVIKEAKEQIKANVDQIMIHLKAELFPLSDEERKHILKSQFELAKQLKEIQNPEIDSTYANIKEKDNSCAIGFPLRANLYAFETNPINKTKDIFADPVSYVIRHFEREIEKDKDTGVKTLFLFLLFYNSPNSLKPSKRLDLRYGRDLREYLEDPKVVPESLLKEIGPLNFENLPTIAESLKYTILLKQSTMFEFKHQIYLDGASDYFFRKYPGAAVRFFPLDIIRPYAFSDASPKVWSDLIQRFKKELQENRQNNGTETDIEFPRMLDVLSCKIFDTVQFEKKFGDEFKQDTTLNWLLFTKELRFPFWAKRYGRKILSDTAIHIVKEHFDFQFYQDLCGECCQMDKKYDAVSGAYMDLERLKERVWKYKTTDKKSILHLVISSDRSDYEAHVILEKMLKDTSKQDVLLINDLLKCASENRICSRILCMLELLRKQQESLTGHKPPDVSNVIAQLKICKDYDAHLELEFLVRICIVFANCEAPTKTGNTEHNSIDKKYRHVRNLLDLDGNVHDQSRMTKTIQDCLAECLASDLPLSEERNIPFSVRISLDLKQAIYDSVRVLSRRKYLLKK